MERVRITAKLDELFAHDPPHLFGSVEPFGYAAVALLVGYFSGEAMEKLRSIAGAFFQSKSQTDSLRTKKPVIIDARIEKPPRGRARLRVVGRNFGLKPILTVNDTPVAPLLMPTARGLARPYARTLPEMA